MAETMEHPPKPRITLHVGVTGHRLNKIGAPGSPTFEAVARTVRTLLTAIKEGVPTSAGPLDLADCYVEGEPILRIISPLAEGADRIVAEEGRKLGYEVQVITPFSADEYAKDFAGEDSSKQFWDMFEDASAVLQLDGERCSKAAEISAYHACGLAMLRQSDLLIAIWDGQAAESKAGTGEIVAVALASQIPVLWIDPNANPVYARVLRRLGDRECDREHDSSELTDEELGQTLARFLPPRLDDLAGGIGPKGGKKLRKHWRDYLAERWLRFPFLGMFYVLWVWLWSCSWLGWGVPLPSQGQRRGEPLPPRSGASDALGTILLEGHNQKVYHRFRQYYIWADQLANHYARQFRGACVLAFCLAPWAIAAAVIPQGFGQVFCWVQCNEQRFTWAEFGLIVVVLILVGIAWGWRWHTRWLEYRFLAEQLRQLSILALLGRTPARNTGSGAVQSWADWLFRAVARECGGVSVDLNKDVREAIAVGILKAQIEDQIGYHNRTHHRCHLIAHRLHVFHLVLFGLTVVVVVAHLSHLVPAELTTALAVIFPALGAASVGLNNQGEFHRVAQSSEIMAERLGKMQQELGELRQPPSATELGDLAERAALLMLKDVLGWRGLFLTRPLEPPA